MVHNTTSADVKRVYERYIIKSEALISELLEVGGLEGNPDDLVRVLLKHTLGGYDITFALRYDKDIFELTDLCLRGVVTKKLKPKIERVPIEYVEYKRKGKLFRRSKPKKFTKKEVNFIKFKIKITKSNKDLYEEFNRVYFGRTYGSVVSKKYKMKRKK